MKLLIYTSLGCADGLGNLALFNTPCGITMDKYGFIYVSDSDNNRICKVTPQGLVTTIAGSGEKGFMDDIGSAAQFKFPIGLAVDSSGKIFVADYSNHK